MESPQATPKQRVRETEKNVQEEMWKFIAATLKQGLRERYSQAVDEAESGHWGISPSLLKAIEAGQVESLAEVKKGSRIRLFSRGGR